MSKFRATWLPGAFIILLAFVVFSVPAAPVRAALTETQIQSVLNLLTAFSVNSATISNVNLILHGQQPSTPALATGGTFTSSLTFGSRGPEVTQLQNLLIAQNLLPAGSATGFFGPLTGAALAKLQKANGLDPIGSVGPKTRVLLNSLSGGSNNGNSAGNNGNGNGNGGSTTPPPAGGGGGSSNGGGVNSTPSSGGTSGGGGGGSSGGGGGGGGGGGSTPPPAPNFGNGPLAQFFNNGRFAIPSGENPNAASKFTIQDDTDVSVGDSSTDKVKLKKNTVVTNQSAGAGVDVTALTIADVSIPSVTPPSVDAVIAGAMQWGTPGVGLAFNQSFTIDLVVSPSFNGDTLDIYRSESPAGPWTQAGIVTTTCVVANGICEFTAINASHFVASKKKPTVTLTANPTSVASGGSTVLTWSSSRATSCTASSTSSSWLGAKTVSGTQTLSNLTTTGTYTLACSNTAGTVAQSVTVTVTGSPTDTTAPSAPTNLAGTAAGQTQINLTWTASTDNVGVTAYQVFRNGTQVGTPTTNSYSDTGLVASTQYSYTVKAVDAAGNVSQVSNTASATTQAPPAPTLTLSANPTSVTSGTGSTLTWSSTNATSCTASGAWTGTKATSGTQSLTNLTTTGTYTLACTGTGGSISKSATITVTTAADTVPPVVNITGPVHRSHTGTTQATLTATTNENASCRYSTNSATAYGSMTAFTTTGASSHSTILTGLTNGTSYTYYVKCQDPSLNTSNNATVSFAVAAATPAPTVSLSSNPTSITSGQTSTLTWSSTNATSCSGTGFTASGTSGSATVSPSATTNYSVTCTGAGGSASANITVTVTVASGGGCTGAANTLDGADPWGGCFPGPNNTGPNAPESTMAAWTGGCTINTPNVIIDSKVVNCSPLNVGPNASGLMIKNSYLKGGVISQDTATFTIQDSFIDNAVSYPACSGGHCAAGKYACGDPNNATTDCGVGYKNFTLLRTEIINTNRAAYCQSNCTIQDNYFHGTNLWPDVTNLAHASSVRNEQGLILRHNSLGCDFPGISYNGELGCSADMSGYPDFTQIKNDTIDKNLFLANNSGQAFCAYGGATAGKPFSGDATNATNIVFTNNVFQRGANGKCGEFGPITDFAAGRTGNVWSGNIMDNGASVNSDGVVGGGGTTPPSTKFAINDRVQVSSGPLNVRATANTTGTLLGTQATNALGTVIGGPTAQGGFNWWNVNYDSGVDGWSAEDFLVKAAATPAPTVTISANPTSITSGQSSTLTWSSTNATSCTASNGWTGTKATSGSATVSPTANATYTLTCTGAGGSGVQSVIVNVSASTPAPTVSLSANPTSITSGQSSTITWSSTNATSCTGTGFTASGTSGSASVSPTVNTTYSVTCTGAGGSASQSTTVTVTVAGGGGCTQTISPSANLANTISAAAGGSVICLNSGTYSTGTTISGISKSPRVTIQSVSGQGATIASPIINAGTSGLTFDHMTVSGTMSVENTGGSQPHDITFTYVNFDNAFVNNENLTNANILYDHTSHNYTTTGGQPCCRFLVEGGVAQPSANSGVTVQYATVKGGNTDGMRFDQSGTLQYSEITNVYEVNTPNHTDSFQCYQCGSGGMIIRGNWFHQSTDATAIYDGWSNGLIEDNIFDMTGSPNGTRPWGIESYAGANVTIRHNTVVYQSQCDPGYGSTSCGNINFGSKGPSVSGIQVYDNIATSIGADPGQTITRQDHNLLRTGAKSGDISGAPVYVGGSFPTTWAGFQLAAGSPGKGAASDGLDIGARTFGAPGTGGGGSTPAPTVSLSANPTPITSGQSSTLTWSSTNATSCTGTGFTASGTSGSATVSPTANTTYSVTCTGAGGSNSSSATVSVNSSTPAPTVTFSASPTTITSGVSATLTWSSTNATSCTASNGWTGTKTTNGTQTVSPTTNTTFTLTCTGTGGSNSASAAVTVTAAGGGGGSTITIGETNILAGDDSGNGNLLIGQTATLSQAATLQSLSFYVRTASGNLRLGVYDATGPSGGPGALKAQTASFVPTTGWNTQSVTPVTLPAGTYWLMYFPSTNALHFNDGAGGSYKYANLTFTSMPATYPAVNGSGAAHWSFYATLTTSGSNAGGTSNAASAILALPMPGSSIGSTVHTTSNLNVRLSPNGQLVGTESAGATGVVSGTPKQAGGYTWRYVEYADGKSGWSIDTYLAQ
jgi:hypothetical protein